MKIKTKTLIFFLISYLIIAFPVYKLTKNKIEDFNINEDLHLYKLNIFAKIEKFDQNFNLMTDHIEKINLKYFSGNKLIQARLASGILTVEGTNLKDRIFFPLYVLALNTDTLFIPLSDIHDQLHAVKNEECQKIRDISLYMKMLNGNDFILKSDVKQSKEENIDETINIFKSCLLSSFRKYEKVYIDQLINYSEVNQEKNKSLLENFVNYNKNLFLSKSQSDDFKIDIKTLERIFFQDLKDRDNLLNFYFNEPFDLETKTVYKKDFSIINVSLIIAFLFNILIFYILYFLSLRIKIFKSFF